MFGIEELPLVALVEIMSYLNLEDLIFLSQVSSKMKEIFYNYWECRCLNFEGCFLSNEDILQLLKSLGTRLRLVKELNLNFCWWLTRLTIQKVLKQCPNIQSLHIIDCHLSVKQRLEITSKCAKLMTISLTLPCDSLHAPLQMPLSQLVGHLNGLSRVTVVVECSSSCSNNFRSFKEIVMIVDCPSLKHLTISFKSNFHEHVFLKFSHSAWCNLESFNWNGPLHKEQKYQLARCEFVLDDASVVMPWREVKLLPHVWNRFIETFWFSSDKPVVNSKLESLCSPDLCTAFDCECTKMLKQVKITKSMEPGEVLSCCPLLTTVHFSDYVMITSSVLQKLPSLLFIQNLHMVGLCVHSQNLCSAIGHLKGLRRLAVSPCAIFDKCSNPKPCTSSQLPEHDMSGFSKGNRTVKKLSYRVSHLSCIVHGCLGLQHFSLAAWDAKGKIPWETPSKFGKCLDCRDVTDEHLQCLSGWKRLQSLTVAGVKGVASFGFLLDILKHSDTMQVLSLDHVGLGVNKGSVSLTQALSHGQGLSTVRLELPHQPLKPVLSALSTLSRLRRVCVGTPHSVTNNSDIQLLLHSMLANNPRLSRVYLFTDDPLVLSRSTKSTLSKRHIDRPGFLFKWFNSLAISDQLQELFKSPFSDLEELVYFSIPVS